MHIRIHCLYTLSRHYLIYYIHIDCLQTHSTMTTILANFGRRLSANTKHLSPKMQQAEQLKNIGLMLTSMGATFGTCYYNNAQNKPPVNAQRYVNIATPITKKAIRDMLIGTALGAIPGVALLVYTCNRYRLQMRITKSNAANIIGDSGAILGGIIGYEMSKHELIYDDDKKHIIGYREKDVTDINTGVISPVLNGVLIGSLPGSLMYIGSALMSNNAYFRFIAGSGIVIGSALGFMSTISYIMNSKNFNNVITNEHAISALQGAVVGASIGLFPAAFMTKYSLVAMCASGGYISYLIAKTYNDAPENYVSTDAIIDAIGPSNDDF